MAEKRDVKLRRALLGVSVGMIEGFTSSVVVGEGRFGNEHSSGQSRLLQ